MKILLIIFLIYVVTLIVISLIIKLIKNRKDKLVKKYVEETYIPIIKDVGTIVCILTPIFNIYVLPLIIVYLIRIKTIEKKEFKSYMELLMYVNNWGILDYYRHKIGDVHGINWSSLNEEDWLRLNREKEYEHIRSVYWKTGKDSQLLDIFKMMMETVLAIYENNELDEAVKERAVARMYTEFGNTIDRMIVIKNKKRKEKIEHQFNKLSEESLDKISEELRIIREYND